MITFKSTDDLSKLPRNDPAFPIVEDLVKRLITDYIAEGYDYRPEDDGYTILVEPNDADRELTELWPGCRLTSVYWESLSAAVQDQGVIYAESISGIRFINNNQRLVALHSL